MGTSEATQRPFTDSPHRISPKELEYIAFSGQREIAHGLYRSIPLDQRGLYTNRFILSEVVHAGVQKLRKFLAASAEGAAQDEKLFIDEAMEVFIADCRLKKVYPRELFSSLLTWGEELSRLSLLREALRYYNAALELEVGKYPDLYSKILLAKAGLLNTMGSIEESQSILLSLASRPYMICDRNVLPNVLFQLGKESILKGDITLYKGVLFRGLRHFYTRFDQRKVFVDQIVLTYRHSINVLLDATTSTLDKVLFCSHRLYFLAARSRLLSASRLTGLLRILLLGCVYCLNYGFGSPLGMSAVGYRRGSKTQTGRRAVLITRSMGGIGDLLMMTPGLHALKMKHPHEEIHLALPRRYFPIFSGNPDVTLLEIDDGHIDPKEYWRWINFSDCPASRVESRSAPKVKKGRIEIFARAMGVGYFRRRRIDKRPRYFVLPEERVFQMSFWSKNGLTGEKVIGVQLRADEVYRDYPHMRELILRLATRYRVLVFDAEKIEDLEHDHVITVDNQPMRLAFALASACDAIVAPDSSFVHLAAALNIPCVALYGPIDGHVRTMEYQNCKYLDAKKKLGCMPCWRNEQIPCKLTGMRSSVCMADISIEEILAALDEKLKGISTV